MTVKELREQLVGCPDEAVIVLQIGFMTFAHLHQVTLIDASGIVGAVSVVALQDKVSDDPR